MKRIITVLMVLVLAGVCWAELIETPATTVLRITDGIGWQYKCISNSLKNQYGFGGVGDTLASDSTVSRGTLMNIKRIKESNDAGLAELLPIFVSSRTQLDSSYLYSKWSAPIWGLNNYYSAIGGLNGWQSARPDSGRFSPSFARIARANGVYLGAKTVFPPGHWQVAGKDTMGMTFGLGTLAVDSAFTYTDSNAIDSTLYGPCRTDATAAGRFRVWIASVTGTGSCSLLVWGSNQSLIHGRKWAGYIDQTMDATYRYFTPNVAGDSIYNIDSAKVKKYTGTLAASLSYEFFTERRDSL